MRVLPLLAALIWAACSRKPAEAPEPALQRFVSVVAAEEPCARAIPSQWSRSWPVPVAHGGRLSYRVFFFGRDGDARQGFRFHQDEGGAEFTPDGRVVSCSKRAASGAPFSAAPGGTPEQFAATLAKERALYAATERVAALFAAGQPLTEEDKKRVAEFAAAFAERAEPRHAAAYRALNPDFWKWVEANGGRSPGA
jgi:hypothetical protein